METVNYKMPAKLTERCEALAVGPNKCDLCLLTAEQSCKERHSGWFDRVGNFFGYLFRSVIGGGESFAQRYEAELRSSMDAVPVVECVCVKPGQGSEILAICASCLRGLADEISAGG